MNCAIYRSSKKDGMYLYVREKDNFDDVPEPVMKQMGKCELAMELELTPDRPLAREDVNKVIANLEEQGFHLQMPPQIDSMAHWDNPKLKEPDYGPGIH